MMLTILVKKGKKNQHLKHNDDYYYPVKKKRKSENFIAEIPGSSNQSGPFCTQPPVMYNARFLTVLIESNENIHSELMKASVELMKHHDSQEMFYISIICQGSQIQTSKHNDKINIHLIQTGQHWVTTAFYPKMNYIHVYDSKKCRDRLHQILPVLKQLHGQM